MHRNEGENMTSGGLFSTGPPYSVLTPEFMNAVQEELINLISQAGLPVLNKGNDTRDQIYTAFLRAGQKYDHYVMSQETFVDLFERTGANSYQIKSDYKSVYFRRITGGYSVSSILSDGDTWGDLYTNTCEHIEFENGAYINFGALPGNLTVETDDCYLKNVNIQGNGSSGAITESFGLGANRVTFDNCKCSNRLSSVDMVGFQGSGTALHNITSKYINCSAYTLDGADKVYGFKDCHNLQNCLAYDLDSTSGVDECHGFSNCNNLNNSRAYSIQAATNQHASGFNYCYQLSSCLAQMIDGTGTGTAKGFDNCSQLSASQAIDIDAIATVAAGFSQCNQVVGCYAEDIDSDSIQACGFYYCDQIAGNKASDIDSVSGAPYGFRFCNYGAALFTDEAVNSGNDWIDTVDAQVTNKVSTPSVWT